MRSNGYEISQLDNFVYYRRIQSDEYIYLFLYVDDILIASKNKYVC